MSGNKRKRNSDGANGQPSRQQVMTSFFTAAIDIAAPEEEEKKDATIIPQVGEPIEVEVVPMAKKKLPKQRKFAKISPTDKNNLAKAALYGIGLTVNLVKAFDEKITLDKLCLEIATDVRPNVDFVAKCSPDGRISYHRKSVTTAIEYPPGMIAPTFPFQEDQVSTKEFIIRTRHAGMGSIANIINVAGDIFLTDNEKYQTRTNIKNSRVSLGAWVPPGAARKDVPATNYDSESNQLKHYIRLANSAKLLDIPGNSVFDIMVIGSNVTKLVGLKNSTNWVWKHYWTKTGAFKGLKAHGGCELCLLPDGRTLVLYNNTTIKDALNVTFVKDVLTSKINCDYEIIEAGDVLQHVLDSNKVCNFNDVDIASSIKSDKCMLGGLGELVSMQLFGGIGSRTSSVSAADQFINGHSLQNKTRHGGNKQLKFSIVIHDGLRYDDSVEFLLPIVVVNNIMRVYLPLTRAQLRTVKANSFSTTNIGQDGFPQQDAHKFLKIYVDVDMQVLKRLMQENQSYTHATKYIKSLRAKFPTGKLEEMFGEAYSPFDVSTTPNEKQAMYKCLCDITMHMF
jgi:hypothetical protein